MICPGFIDLHNHSDQDLLQPATRTAVNYVTQGCTTIVTGNCGFGAVDVAAYYQQLETLGTGVNVAHLIPQGVLRNASWETNSASSDDELERMAESVHRGMLDGAWGMSSGLIYVPSSYASREELVRLAECVGQHGGIYASHIRNENLQLLEAIEEAHGHWPRGPLACPRFAFQVVGQRLLGTGSDRCAADRKRPQGRPASDR